MRYYVYRCDGGSELEVQGVFQEGETEGDGRPPHWIDIADADLPETLRKLTAKFAVMLLPPSKANPHYSIWLDSVKWKFRQR